MNPKNNLIQQYRDLMAEEQQYLRTETELPHLYAFGWYEWALTFFNSVNKVTLLCAGNQLSKSSSQIRKVIHWATEKSLWPQLWPAREPRLFWYLYPSQPVINTECMTKWEPEFLPKGSMKNDPKYGWQWIKKGEDYKGIRFNSGIIMMFKMYSQSSTDLQTATVDYLAADEELPVSIYDELMFRISSTDGYFSMVFTATLGQEFWRRAMEPRTGEEEALVGALKLTVSAYDCLKYVDGRASPVTLERISRMKALCKNDTEINKRIFGRFIKADGRMYEGFDMMRNVRPRHPIPSSWLIYGGVDIGSGGAEEIDEHGKKKKPAHPSAIAYIAVSPDFTQGRVFLGWRGDGVKTIAGDVFNKYQALVFENKLQVTQQAYDFSSADFGTIAATNGVAFTKAIKNRTDGIGLVNTLFKHNMLHIYDDPELMKLASELSTLDTFTDKSHAKDDFCDALRYCAIQIPWDMSQITKDPLVMDMPLTDASPKQVPKDRHDLMEEQYQGRNLADGRDTTDAWGIEAELDEWAGMLD